MYIWKYDNLCIKNQIQAGKEIGLTRQYLCRICAKKTHVKKTIAYCITKYINEDAEIEDFFIKIEKEK